jgi:hypothetical protein
MSREHLEMPLAMSHAFNPSRLSRLRDRGRGVHGLGDVTLAHIRGWGYGADSATPLIDPFCMPLTWRDGKCVWWRNGARSPRSRGRRE